MIIIYEKIYDINILNHFGIGLNIPSAGNFFKFFKSYFGIISIKKSKISVL
jgi:hypothetical protein